MRETDFRLVDAMQNYIETCMGSDQNGVDQYKETLYVVKSDKLPGFVFREVPNLVSLAFKV